MIKTKNVFLMKSLINLLNKVFFVLSIVLFLILVIIAFQALTSGNYCLLLNEDGFKNFQDFWEDYSILLKGFASSATISIAGYNLTKYIDIAAIESLSNLRNRFNESGKRAFHVFMMKREYDMKKREYPEANEYKKTDFALADEIKKDGVSECSEPCFNPCRCSGNTDFDSADVLDYLGTVELGYLMYRRRLITLDEFWNQFGYRLEYLLENQGVVDHINNNYLYYENMIQIINILHEKGKLVKELFDKIKPQ